jgi:hypothetical protein
MARKSSFTVRARILLTHSGTTVTNAVEAYTERALPLKQPRPSSRACPNRPCYTLGVTTFTDYALDCAGQLPTSTGIYAIVNRTNGHQYVGQAVKSACAL